MHTLTSNSTPDTRSGSPVAAVPAGVLDLEIVVPVYNEERVLASSIHRLYDFLSTRGFKAVRTDVLPELLDGVRDDGWFFDMELLILGQRRGMRIHEVPVDWVEDGDSRVAIASTALADLRGIARLAIAAPLARFLAVGVASTLAYAMLFLALAGLVGSAAASAVALALTAVANTAANRRLTFGIRGRDRLARQHLAGFVVFLLALALTNGALGALHRLHSHAPRLLEAAVLVLATLAATVTRYIALATWVFRSPMVRKRRGAVLSASTRGAE